MVTKSEVLRSRSNLLLELESFVDLQLGLLPLVERAWQPSDVLPFTLATKQDPDALHAFIASCQLLSWEIMVILVGNTITEEALPNYSAALRRVDGLHSMSGDSASPWMQWTRAWTAEENRHGDLLGRFLMFSGRIDGPALERCVHRLIRNGFDTGDDSDPLRTFVYTAFQERATRISHQNVAILAERAGDPLLGRICRLISADETRHEEVYVRIMSECFRLEPGGSLQAYADMMRKKVVMPGVQMSEENGDNLFVRFACIAETQGTYTAHDYISIIKHLNKRWRIANLSVSGTAAALQDYLCSLPERMQRVLDRRGAPVDRVTADCFSWVSR